MHEALSAAKHLTPTKIMFGSGSLRRAGEVVGHIGTRALVVTSRAAVSRHGYTKRVANALECAGVHFQCFAVPSSSITTGDVDSGADVARRFEADVVVCLGGGSAIDLGKAVAGVAPMAANATDVLYGRRTICSHALSIVAIPTTAGTGSEVNRSSIVTDPARPFRDGIRSDYIFPRCAIVDPSLTLTVGGYATALTGFDTLAHAIESFVSPRSQPATDELSRMAIGLVGRFLPTAIDHPDNLEARESLSLAATAMGLNLARVGTCFPHRVDKAICALRPDIPHGQSVALSYPFWLQQVESACIDRISWIETEIQATAQETGPSRGQIIKFIDRLGLLHRLSDLGILASDIPLIAKTVPGDLSVNPVPVDRTKLCEILTAYFQ